MEDVEDGIVGRARGADAVIRAVVHREPLSVCSGGLNARWILPPGIAIVIRDRAIEFFKRAFQVTEVNNTLVVSGNGRITSARRRVRPKRRRADHVELISAID